MNNYETVLILNKNLKDSEIDAVTNKLTDIVIREGKVKEVEKLGVKRLAYEVRKQKEGYYLVINYKTKPDNVYKLERVCRITDEILKFITVKRED